MSKSDEYLKKSFESITGIKTSSQGDLSPASGFVITKSQMDEKKRLAKERGAYAGDDAIYELEDSDVFGDGLTAHGDIQVILRPEISNRTAYMRGDPISSGGRPVLMNSDTREDILDAIANADGKNRKSHMADAVINLLKAKTGKSVNINASRKVKNGENSSTSSNSVMHAQILGGYSLSDIEGIHYPFSKVQKVSANTEISDVTKNIITIKDIMAQKVNEHDAKILLQRIESGSIDIPSINALRDYRTAMKIREAYKKKGIGYVLFAHKDGINIDNPKSYDPNSKSGETVEEVLKRKIQSEVKSSIKKLATGMAKARDGK